MERLKVFYSPKQSVASLKSFSPSAGKPEKLVAQWLERYPIEIVEPRPVTLQDLGLAHDPSYVLDVIRCRRDNGFGNRSAEVADSLPWTSGSMVSAVQYVLAHGGVACSPTSGFHHAGYNFSQGYCTFNGLMVAALMVRQQVNRVAILDCDYHYGNGTDDIIRQLELGFVAHYTTGKSAQHGDAERFLGELPSILEQLAGDVLLYQAGADAHVWDPLGGWMTSGQMRRRDRLVFDWCRGRGTPVVWNLAGGYQEDFQSVLDLHHATLEECLRAFQEAAPPEAGGGDWDSQLGDWWNDPT